MTTPVSKSSLFKSWKSAQTQTDQREVASDKSMIQTFKGYKTSNDKTYEAAIKADPSRKSELQRDMHASDTFFGNAIKGEQKRLAKADRNLASLGNATPDNMTSRKDFQSWLGGQIDSTQGRISLEKEQLQTVQKDHLGGPVLGEIQQRLTSDEATLAELEKFRR